MARPLPRIAPVLSILATLALGCGTSSGEDGGGGGIGQACDTPSDCESGVCDPDQRTCVENACDPEAEEIGPTPDDRPDDACCTEKPGCTGYDRMGEPINPQWVGDTMACVGGVWVDDPTYCDGECPDGTSLLGCVWDSAQGNFVKPLCVCQSAP